MEDRMRDDIGQRDGTRMSYNRKLQRLQYTVHVMSKMIIKRHKRKIKENTAKLHYTTVSFPYWSSSSCNCEVHAISFKTETPSSINSPPPRFPPPASLMNRKHETTKIMFPCKTETKRDTAPAQIVCSICRLESSTGLNYCSTVA
jgi:hypothetical protein